MTTSAPGDKHEAEEPDFKPLTAEEAAEWRKRNPGRDPDEVRRQGG